MEPIARRTRRQTEEDIMRRYAEWKKSQPSSAPKRDPPAPPRSGISRGSSASVTANRSPVLREEEADEGERRGSSDHTGVDDRVAKEEVVETGNVAERSHLLLVSSSSESQEGYLVSRSDSESSESVLREEEVDEGARRGSSDRTAVDRRLAKEEEVDTGNVVERSHLLLVSSSSESQEGDLVSSSDSESSESCEISESSDSGKKSSHSEEDSSDSKEEEEEEAKINSGSIEPRSRKEESGADRAKIQSLERPIVIDVDYDDDEDLDDEESGVGGEFPKRGKVDVDGSVDDVDDHEESSVGRMATKRDKEKAIEQLNRKDRKRPFTDVDGSHSRFNRSDVEVDGGGDNEDQGCPRKKLFDDYEEEEIRVGREAPRVTEQLANRRDRKKPLTAGDIGRVLFNSIMDADDGVIEEPVSPHKTEDTVSSSKNDDDSGLVGGLEKPEQETKVDSMYKLMNFCLACDGNDVDNDAADAFVEEEEALLDARKSREQLCNEGKHHFVLDEEIGILCKSCGLVREEIKYVIPSFHKNLFGHLDRNRYSMYDHRDGGDRPCIEDNEYNNDQEDANFDPSGTVWEIIPGIWRTLLPHQREGFEFIWRNVAGGTKLDELTSNGANDGGGCLISHAPGTGKTRLAIAFLETYMKLYKNSRPVILAPAGILLTWKKEFEKWKVGIPFQNLIDEELSKEEIALAISLGIRVDKNLEKTTKRLIKLLFWKRHESVLAVSYTLFAQLAGGESMKKRGKTNISRCLDESEMFRVILLDRPGLLILDEGHMPRNERSCMFKVLSEVKTKRRFILSGTPFQNNFRELHNILGLVLPKIWEKNPFNSRVEKADEHKIRELKAKMEPFFQCYEGGIVAKMVPGLNDNFIFLEPSQLQKKLLRDVDMDLKKSHFEANVATSLISVHPRLMDLKDRSLDFVEELKSGKLDIADGAKMRFLIRLIELSLPLEEKVLVFSEYLQPLNFVKALLESSDHFGWREGWEILVMSGLQDMETRKRNVDVFNRAGSEAKVMLASIKAVAEGIELTGASRVVLLDVTWNPAVERQAISRAYRLGQGRVVHVYHLLMTDYDSNRHTSQTHKNKCSNYLFSSHNRKNDAPGSSKPASEDIILEQLLRENVIKEAMQRNVCEPGLDNGP